MIGLNTVIKDGHDDPFAGVTSSPGRLNIHVEAAPGSAVQVPLLVEHGVVGEAGAGLPFGRLTAADIG